LPAGNYKIEVTPYSSNGNVSVATTRSDLCVVEATGTSTCNVALKSPNLKGKITDQFGAVARFTQAYVLMQQAGGERWVRWLELREGLFDTYLEDGTYRIQVMPYWEYRKTYTDRSYIITVESVYTRTIGNNILYIRVTSFDKKVAADVKKAIKKLIFLSGSPELSQKNGIHVGRLSGIVNHHVPNYLRRNQLPSYQTNCMEDWEKKLDKMFFFSFTFIRRLCCCCCCCWLKPAYIHSKYCMATAAESRRQLFSSLRKQQLGRYSVPQ
jgi:hypothetical protein